MHVYYYFSLNAHVCDNVIIVTQFIHLYATLHMYNIYYTERQIVHKITITIMFIIICYIIF